MSKLPGRVANSRRTPTPRVMGAESDGGEQAQGRVAITPAEYRALRESRGWSQVEAGRRVGTRANTIARRERGELPIDGEAWLAMLHVVDVTE